MDWPAFHVRLAHNQTASILSVSYVLHLAVVYTARTEWNVFHAMRALSLFSTTVTASRVLRLAVHTCLQLAIHACNVSQAASQTLASLPVSLA